jgi:hypothetical protein
MHARDVKYIQHLVRIPEERDSSGELGVDGMIRK